MIAIPSVNPGNQNCYEETLYGEHNLANYICDYFKNHTQNFIVERHKVLKGRDNVLIFTGKDQGKDTILLETHMDTVDVANMKSTAFRPTLINGRLHGRGACDAKGQIVSMIAGVEKSLEEAEGQLPVNVCLALVIDEEHLHRGVDDLIRMGIEAKCAIVGEPTDLRVASASKGSIRFKIKARGVSAHTSTPHRGKNAIYLMSKIVRVIEEKIVPEVEKNKHNLCGNSSISISIITGGEQVNIVPDYCEIHVDRRLIPGESWEDAYNDIKHMILPELTTEEIEMVSFEKPYLVDPYFETDIESDIIARFSKILGKYNLQREPIGLPFGCDASKINLLDIPTVVFGPGSIKEAHSKNEFIDIDDLVKAVFIYKDLILSFR